MATSLSNKVAIVTGASKGLGRGIAEALAAKGARVIAIARDPTRLSKMTSEVPGAEAVPGNAADEALAERLLRTEACDFLILCAGAMPALAPLHEQTWEGFSTNWGVDAKGTFVWLRQALRTPMKPGAHIIVVSSGAAVQGSPISGGYAAAKRAQWFMAEYALAESERSKLGLRIHCLLPNINPSTELGRAGIAAYAKRAGVTPEEFAKKFGPPLTPEIMGKGVLELIEGPERFTQMVYRIGGGGLVALNEREP